jgi:GH15 family glucan-1,4-alpha-glucosidase
MPAATEDYGLIGDCETAALVSRDGSIDWLCWPRFDSGACFAALLGNPGNGRWQIAPANGSCKITRRYLPETLILETTFFSDEGEVTLTDFFPIRAGASHIVRLVTGVKGSLRMHCELALRFDYGASIPWVRRTADGALLAVSGPDQVVLYTPVALRGQGMTTVADFTVLAGHTLPFVLMYAPSHLPMPEPIDSAQALRKTEVFWRDWASAHEKQGMPEAHAQAVTRSLITLKSLIYAPTGGIVAAPTTSLPEQLGGTRNWDYRICWLRDATLTLLAFMNAGYFDEARDWRKWLLRAAAGSPSQMQIMYGLAGEKRMTECELPWLDGYEGSKPVRIGNAASEQLQIDVYGEVMSALHHARVGILRNPIAGWDFQRELARHVEAIWTSPDEGIWEVRSGRQHFVHSKVMAWVAIDRAIRSAELFGLDGPIDHWCELRDRMHAEICEKGFDARIGAFVQTYGSENLDASALLIPSVGFLPADDPRVAGTIAAIERRLMPDGLVLRYDTGDVSDGLPPGEGAFLPCSFWMVDAWLATGRREEAEDFFARLLGLRNDLGLLAEEYDFKGKRQLGNFPQAFSHIALVHTAHNLLRHSSRCHERPHPIYARNGNRGGGGG